MTLSAKDDVLSRACFPERGRDDQARCAARIIQSITHRIKTRFDDIPDFALDILRDLGGGGAHEQPPTDADISWKRVAVIHFAMATLPALILTDPIFQQEVDTDRLLLRMWRLPLWTESFINGMPLCQYQRIPGQHRGSPLSNTEKYAAAVSTMSADPVYHEHSELDGGAGVITPNTQTNTQTNIKKEKENK